MQGAELEAIINEAGEFFGGGYQKNEELRSRIFYEPEFAAQARLFKYRKTWIAKRDDGFEYDANQIPGSHLIAGAGPRTWGMMRGFIRDIAFNPKLPIRNIVALGHCAAREPETFCDFYNYCLAPGVEYYGDYRVEAALVSGNVHTSPYSNQIFPEKAVTTTLKISDVVQGQSREVSVTVISQHDNLPITLDDELREKIWQLHLLSLHEPVFVHCAAGVGRTGHFILMLEILKNYDDIFSDIHQAATKIHQLLVNMRDVRPGLVITRDQYIGAIRNAVSIHTFALEHGYLPTPLARFVNVG